MIIAKKDINLHRHFCNIFYVFISLFWLYKKLTTPDSPLTFVEGFPTLPLYLILLNLSRNRSWIDLIDPRSSSQLGSLYFINLILIVPIQGLSLPCKSSNHFSPKSLSFISSLYQKRPLFTNQICGSHAPTGSVKQIKTFN